ncbi:polysaccharide biosynthesis/export family protein [Aurantiacibacter poecillastricola]|uniref:polysaccharide biosynthesis/export family protein n=1 Tax=Aurantiacibacter poecillastricola TaxID=3064385 RepID=UPI00273CF75D|nr:polysaccharide biosynthesis/export family protein [Aurantiacibacter sp. 219JJ12-13]MDP5260010.1 polysaccharide biosynthesis/export family protein [Aurantiacibacter sp. 219JJ12-13]
MTGTNIARSAALFVATVALGACASTDRTYGAASGVEVSSLTELPAPATTNPRFSPMGIIEVTVAQDDTLSGTYVIDESGMLDFPLIGEVAALGLSPTQLASVIASRLSGEFVLDPSVTVSAIDAAPPSISIGGQVEDPGNYPTNIATTLMRAINTAGGLGEYAREDDVLIFREIDGERYIGLYNLEAIMRGNLPDPALYEGDIVMVGDSPGERRLERILQILPAVTSSLVLIDRVGN